MGYIKSISLQQYITQLIKKEQIKSFLDIGCGVGSDLSFFKNQFGDIQDSRYVGIDKIGKSIVSACENYSSFGMEFYTMDVADGLNFAENSFDIIYSMNMLECIKDKPSHIKEIHRVIKKGGQVVYCHCDWDSIVFNGEDKDLINKVINQYSKWKQPWMDDADSWIGRRLWGLFNSTSMFSGEINIFNIIETDYIEGSKGWEMVKGIGYMLEADVISKDDYDRFVNEIVTTAKNGQYLYVQPIYIYSGVKI